MNTTDNLLYELLEAKSENKTLRTELKRVNKILSQYEQPVPDIDVIGALKLTRVTITNN